MSKPKMSNKKFLSIWTPVLAIVAVLAIVINVLAVNFEAMLTTYIGKKPYTIVQAEGTEGWDSEYYVQTYKTKEEATAAAEKFVTKIGDEGIVLLKNDNGALPLNISSVGTIALMGRYSADPVYGGSGSGTVDKATCIDFKKGLENAGFKVNDTYFAETEKLYPTVDRCNIVMDNPAESTFYIGEIPVSSYKTSTLDSVKGQVAVIVLGRGGGEGWDLQKDLLKSLDGSTGMKPNAETANYEKGQHQLELTKEEKDLIAFAKQNCTKTIVVLNVSTSMELGPLTEGEYEVDAILEVGSIGSTAATALGRILSGEVNPSGRTVDLWATDFTHTPSFYNIGEYQYTNVSDYYGGSAYFIECEEGIYVGYKYYETAYAESLKGNYAGFDYDKEVVYPFGYGLSYTTFEQTLNSVTKSGDDIVVEVTVKNTGNVAGKEVVEVYYTAPYIKGGLEKSEVNLAAFEKTSEIAPGQSEKVTLTFAVRDMASYDSGKAAYVMDAGEYVISLRKNSHDVIDSKTLKFGNEVFTTDSATGNEISNKFDDLTTYMNENTVQLSRADFAGTFPTEAKSKEAPASVLKELVPYVDADHNDPNDVMPVTGADHVYDLIDMRGLDFNDERWDVLLDQLTVEEMLNVLEDGAYNTAAIESINKPKTTDPDGPQGFTSLMGSTGNCAYCSEYLMAQTWSKELMEEYGIMIGEEALASGYNGWYAPAMNTHRSPFAGRNFEYYSEDPVLAGNLAAATVQGAASKGCYAYIKHFAMNDTEIRRTEHQCTWASEQAVREVYLKPFELAIKNSEVEIKYLSDSEGTISTKKMSGCTGVMSSFNYVGAVWAGGRDSLCNGMLRDEWGFEGFVITDFNLYPYMQHGQGFRAGTDLHLTWKGFPAGNALQDSTSATAVKTIRENTHRLLYTVANSNAMQHFVPGTTFVYGLAWWQIVIYCLTAAMGIFVVAGTVWVVIRVRKNKSEVVVEK